MTHAMLSLIIPSLLPSFFSRRADWTNKLDEKCPFLYDRPDYFHRLEDVWEFRASVPLGPPIGWC